MHADKPTIACVSCGGLLYIADDGLPDSELCLGCEYGFRCYGLKRPRDAGDQLTAWRLFGLLACGVGAWAATVAVVMGLLGMWK